MARTIRGYTVDKTLIVDDQQDARESYEDTVTDAELTPMPEEGPVESDVAGYLGEVRDGPATALLCDHMLAHRHYARFKGAELVAQCVGIGIPAVLCTDYRELTDEIRPFRRWIPSLQRPDEMGPHELVSGFEDCLREIGGEFSSRREPWRTMVKVLEVMPEDRRFLVEVPAWGPTVVPLPFQNVAEEVVSVLAPELRCRALVNLSAESLDEIYFCNWTLIK